MGNKVHMDITSEGMLKVVGTLLVLSGLLLCPDRKVVLRRSGGCLARGAGRFSPRSSLTFP
jgi:hypothetical protein